MKSLSCCEAARCDERQFRVKMKVSTRAICELSLFDKVVNLGLKKERKKERKEEKRKKITKIALSLLHTFAVAVLSEAFGQLLESC